MNNILLETDSELLEIIEKLGDQNEEIDDDDLDDIEDEIDSVDSKCIFPLARIAIEKGKPQLLEYLLENYNFNRNQIGFLKIDINNFERVQKEIAEENDEDDEDDEDDEETIDDIIDEFDDLIKDFENTPFV